MNGWQHSNCSHARCLDRCSYGCACDKKMLSEIESSADWSKAPNLWGAVLWQALREAQYTDRSESKHGWKRRAARRWIFHGGLDYRIVCHLAGVDASGFQEGARRLGLHE